MLQFWPFYLKHLEYERYFCLLCFPWYSKTIHLYSILQLVHNGIPMCWKLKSYLTRVVIILDVDLSPSQRREWRTKMGILIEIERESVKLPIQCSQGKSSMWSPLVIMDSVDLKDLCLYIVLMKIRFHWITLTMNLDPKINCR